MSENQEQAAAAKTKTADEIYCPSCGATISKESEICPKCGVAKAKWRNKETIFCYSCGEKIRGEAEICVKCGVRQLQNAPRQKPNIFLNIFLNIVLVVSFALIIVSCFLPFVNLSFVHATGIDLIN